MQWTTLNKVAFILCNKEGRIERLCGMLEAVKGSGVITKSEAAQIQGHLNLQEVSSYPRCLLLQDWQTYQALGSDDLTKLCTLAMTMLKAMPPREYLSEFFKNPFLIFTDGAWEDGKATGGAITYNPLTGSRNSFETCRLVA